MNSEEVEQALADVSTAEIAKAIVSAHEELKRRYFAGDHRPHIVEAGRFAEGVFRLAQARAGLPVTRLDKPLTDVPKLLSHLASARGVDESIRLRIPRALFAVYDCRNTRDAAHLSGTVSVNFMDATYVVGVCDWVMAELVRLFVDVPADDAQAIVDGLVTKKSPIVWNHGETLRIVLKSGLPLREELLLLLSDGASTVEEFVASIPGADKATVRARLADLVKQRQAARPTRGTYVFTPTGQQEADRLIQELQPGL